MVQTGITIHISRRMDKVRGDVTTSLYHSAFQKRSLAFHSAQGIPSEYILTAVSALLVGNQER